jgi:hypothetical protein
MTTSLRAGVDPFDLIISVSSEENGGLGRYWDPINPWADVEHVTALSKISAMIFLAVPTSNVDCLVFNAHRFYGPVRWELLTRAWDLVELIGDAGRVVPLSSQRRAQPVNVLRSKSSSLQKSLHHHCPHNPTLSNALEQYAARYKGGSNNNDKDSGGEEEEEEEEEDWLVFTCNCVNNHKCTTKFSSDQMKGTGTDHRPGCSCGGLGDRMNGIMSALVFALLTERSFAIDWQSPCPLEEHLVPAHDVNWATKRWKSAIKTDAAAVGCMTLFDYPPNQEEFNHLNLTEIMRHHKVVRLSTNVNLLPALWSSTIHGNQMREIFGGAENRPLFTKHFGCLFSFLFQLSPVMETSVTRALNYFSTRRRENSGAFLPVGERIIKKTLGVQIRLGGIWDLDLMEVPHNLTEWENEVRRRVEQEKNTTEWDIFVTSDQSTAFPHINSRFKNDAPRIRVHEIQSRFEDDVHLDHVDKMFDDARPGTKSGSIDFSRDEMLVAPDTLKCDSRIGKMFMDWWILASLDVVFCSMSGFGASAIWRTRHNDSWILHSWASSGGSSAKRYLYFTDWQLREAEGDDGRRVRREVPEHVSNPHEN